MVALGEWYTVKLSQHATERFNSDNPAAPPVLVGTPRPALVVGINDAVPAPKDQQGNPIFGGDGQPMPGKDRTVNLLIFHDAATHPHYVAAVPLDALVPVGSPASTEQPDTAGTGNPGQRTWNPNEEGNGTTYQGPGPGVASLQMGPESSVQSPNPGDTVSGQQQAVSSNVTSEDPENWG